MKYKIGDKVYYNQKKYVICGAYEETKLEIKPNRYDEKGECKSATMTISYDLRDDNGEIICNIGEYELTDEIDMTDYKFEEGVEYALRNGLIVTYCSICDSLETDDGIEIPIELYRANGTCISSNDFDIVNQKTNMLDDGKSEEDIALSSPDGKYNVKVINKPYGFGIMGELPDSMREIFENAIKMIGENVND
jgi:hypothetical protein